MPDTTSNMHHAAATYQSAAKAGETDRLILDNIDFVGKILSTMSVAIKSRDARENLQASGMLGLVEAANGYDSSRGVPFRTFAYPRIRGAIINELRKLSPVSQRVLNQIGQLRRAYELIEPPATPELLAQHTGLDIEQVYQCLEAMRFMAPEDWNDFSGVVHGSWSSKSINPANDAERREMRELLAEAIVQLPERERLVISLYYSDDLNLAEIGAVIDLSESRVSRILAGARFKIKEFLRGKI